MLVSNLVRGLSIEEREPVGESDEEVGLDASRFGIDQLVEFAPALHSRFDNHRIVGQLTQSVIRGGGS
jgi:hypothetical protein